MLHKIRTYLLLTAAILLIIYLLQSIHWLPSLSNPFRSEPLVIDNTPVLIKEIHKLSQVITISMYDEVVMDATRPRHLPGLPALPLEPDRIVLIGKGKVLAGVDLSKMKEKDLFIDGDSVSLRLSNPEIFSTIVNPSDFETFDELGPWTQEEVTEIKKKIRAKLTTRALENQIFPRALQRCKLVLENFLRALGFKKIYFIPLT